MDLMAQKYRFGKERQFGGKRSRLKRIRGYNTVEERNDKNNVIVNYLFIKYLSKGLSKGMDK